jgi:epoxyqueuosine reductase
MPLLYLSEDAFRLQFGESPIKRAKRRGLLRNVAVALGNLRDPRALPALQVASGDSEPLIRGHAAWALGRIGGLSARYVLQTALRTERDADVQEEIRAALAELAAGDEEFLPARTLRSRSEGYRGHGA